MQLSDVVAGPPPNKTCTLYPSGLHNVDINGLTTDDCNLLELARPAFKKYNEEQLTTVKLPGGSKSVRSFILRLEKTRKKLDSGIAGPGQLSQLACRRQILRCGELKLLRFRSYKTGTALSVLSRRAGADRAQKASDVRSHNIESEHTSLGYAFQTSPYSNNLPAKLTLHRQLRPLKGSFNPRPRALSLLHLRRHTYSLRLQSGDPARSE